MRPPAPAGRQPAPRTGPVARSHSWPHPNVTGERPGNASLLWSRSAQHPWPRGGPMTLQPGGTAPQEVGGAARRARSPSRAESVDVVVVGAGQAGLSLSHELSHADVEHVVLDRGQVG